MRLLSLILLVLPQLAFSQPVRTSADVPHLIESLKNVLHPGHHFQTPTKSKIPLEMVKEYVSTYHDGDNLEFEFIEESSRVIADEMQAGTLSDPGLEDAIADAFRWQDYNPKLSESEKQAIKGQILELIGSLYAISTVRFGYHGFHQNYCAAPAPELLVLDTDAQVAYGIDLNPCEL